MKFDFDLSSSNVKETAEEEKQSRPRNAKFKILMGFAWVCRLDKNKRIFKELNENPIFFSFPYTAVLKSY